MSEISRRDLLRGAGSAAGLGLGVRLGLLGAVTGSAVAASQLRKAGAATPWSTPLPFPQVITDSEITLEAAEADVPILPGAATRMWTFRPAGATAGTWPGPTIRRPSGNPTTLTVRHLLPASADTLTIHHHGSHSASVDDGLPAGVNPDSPVLKPGGERVYVYEHQEAGEPERAAMQWYHDHSHGRTSFNSWMGLGGLFILDDDVEAAMPLPRGAYEVPLFLADRSFLPTNQLDTSAFTSAHNEVGGTTYLANGAYQPFLEVEPRRYRLRVHNGSGFRAYNLTLAVTASADPTAAVTAGRVPVTQIGTESGLLPAPVPGRTEMLLGPAERADLIVDFSSYAGSSVVLASVPRSNSRAIVDGLPVSVPVPGTDVGASAVFLQLRVGSTVTEPDPGPPPAALRPLPAWAAGVGGPTTKPDRVFAFGRGLDTSTTPPAVIWTINGRPFDPTRVDAQPVLGTTETWLLFNVSPSTHLVHLHDVDWLVLSRNGAAPAAHEAGLKETFRLDPGEFVLVATTFTDHLGPYMFHCHMLDHEDAGMMGTFEVVAPGGGSPTTMTDAESRRVGRLREAAATTPGLPAPRLLLDSLDPAAGARVTGRGDRFTCD